MIALCDFQLIDNAHSMRHRSVPFFESDLEGRGAKRANAHSVPGWAQRQGTSGDGIRMPGVRVMQFCCHSLQPKSRVNW